MDIYVSKKPTSCSKCYFCSKVSDELRVEKVIVTKYRRHEDGWMSEEVVKNARLMWENKCILLDKGFIGNTPYCERLEKCPLVEISEVLGKCLTNPATPQ